MTDPLAPPPPRDLPPMRSEEIRAAVLAVARTTPVAPAPQRRRTAAIGALAAAAVLVVVALVIGVGWSRAGSAPVVGVPTTAAAGPGPSGTAPSGGATPTPRPTGTPSSSGPPTARATDEGPLSRSAVRTLAASCAADLGRTATVETVHLARQTSVVGPVLLFTATDGQSYLCGGGRSTLYDGSRSKTSPLPKPSDATPAVQVMAPDAGLTWGNGTLHSSGGAAYLVSSRVARLQARLSVEGHAGPWYDATLEDGYAYASAELRRATSGKPRSPLPDVVVDVRAYDATGRRLRVDDEPR